MKAMTIAVAALLAGFATGVDFAQAASKPGADKEGREGRGRFDRLKSLDSDRDGAVTAEEFAKEQEQRFSKRDANKDGRLTAEEVVATRGGKASAEGRADRMLKRYDANADERITKEEYESGHKAWFAKRDKDGDGKITQAEAPRWGRRRGGDAGPQTLEAEQARAAERFKVLDTNSDGAVDAAEITATETDQRAYRIKRAMHRLDQNRDGQVTPEEFMASAKARFGSLDLDSNGRITAEDLPPQARLMWTQP